MIKTAVNFTSLILRFIYAWYLSILFIFTNNTIFGPNVQNVFNFHLETSSTKPPTSTNWPTVADRCQVALQLGRGAERPAASPRRPGGLRGGAARRSPAPWAAKTADSSRVKLIETYRNHGFWWYKLLDPWIFGQFPGSLFIVVKFGILDLYWIFDFVWCCLRSFAHELHYFCLEKLWDLFDQIFQKPSWESWEKKNNKQVFVGALQFGANSHGAGAQHGTTGSGWTLGLSYRSIGSIFIMCCVMYKSYVWY